MDIKKLKTRGYQARRSIILLSVMILLGVFFINFTNATVTTDGSTTTNGLYTIVTFTSNGYFNTTGSDINISYLIVAGGGGGGQGSGNYGGSGGGGAGGLLYLNSYNLASGNFVVVVGSGGANLQNGQNSSFSTLIAVGGGYGGTYDSDNAQSGGSGGGGAGRTTAQTLGGNETTGQGYKGGNGSANGGTPYGAGGGGSSQTGTSGIYATAEAGHGGNGTCYNIYNGTCLYYAGGGGGASWNGGIDGLGGMGGGGVGHSLATGGNGVANTGGGGGGGKGNGGTGGSGFIIIRYLTSAAATTAIVNLTYPTNNTVTSTSSNLFNVSLSMSGTNFGYSWKNNTFYVWYDNGTLFNTTYSNGLTTNATSIVKTINNFKIGTYFWNSYACHNNVTFGNCFWATTNNTFSIGSSINSLTYNNATYETSLEQFIINVSLAEGAEVSLVQLIYNGTTYTVSNITSVGNNYILEKKINIPLNVNASANQTNTFYFKFTYGGSSVQTFSSYNQNSSFINLVKCGGAYITQALNFTFYDEYSQVNINPANKTTLYSSFKYWLGDGSLYKNYSFQNISSSLNNYTFCIFPYALNITFKTDMDMNFYADTYREGTYYLRNATLTNISSDILLYLIPQDYATKFFLTFQYGNNLVSMGTINVQEYFVGLGMYKTVAILLTDMNGQATMWQEVDKSYRYSIVQDNYLLGIVDRISICSATPCALTIQITKAIGQAFESYNEYYAKNILSDISYDKTTGNVTYTFIDTTGLANYFRFEIKQSKVDGTGGTICDLFSYSSAGTLTCDLTNLTGDFVATGYISRSPEKLDKFLSFVIDVDLLANLGTIGVLLVMILIITIVIGGVVISKGNPTTVLFLLGMAILGTKLIGILFFSWTLVVVLEVIIFWMIFQIKS